MVSLAMPPLPDARHERFAQLMADKRMSNAEAYREALGKPEMTPDVAAVMATKWLNRVNVAARITELKAQAEEVSTLTRQEAVGILCDVITTGARQVDPDGPLCQSYKRHKTPQGEETETITMPSKMEALKQLAAMCGWNSAVKVDLGDNMTALIQKIRKRQ
jgi:hypothetical protein